MHLKLSTLALASVLSIAACGDDDPSGDGGSDSPDSAVKDSGPSEDAGSDDSGSEDAG